MGLACSAKFGFKGAFEYCVAFPGAASQAQIEGPVYGRPAVVAQCVVKTWAALDHIPNSDAQPDRASSREPKDMNKQGARSS